MRSRKLRDMIRRSGHLADAVPTRDILQLRVAEQPHPLGIQKMLIPSIASLASWRQIPPAEEPIKLYDKLETKIKRYHSSHTAPTKSTEYIRSSVYALKILRILTSKSLSGLDKQ